MRMSRRIVLIVAAVVLCPTFALAQGARVRSADESPLAQEALAFRERVRAAVVDKNRSALNAAYADNFMHLRDSGRVDSKPERIALLLKGDSTIESEPEENMTAQVYGPAMVAVTGVSPIRDPQSRRNVRFRWLTVYVKEADGWKVALSQASRAQQGGR